MSPTESAPAEQSDSINLVSLSCPYCTSPMDPPRFTAWPSEPRLITGECLGCGRSVTLPSQWLAGARLPVQR
jgi:hypothetical protein